MFKVPPTFVEIPPFEVFDVVSLFVFMCLRLLAPFPLGWCVIVCKLVYDPIKFYFSKFVLLMPSDALRIAICIYRSF